MNCEGVRERLSAYVDGELTDLERVQVRTHLQRCQSCAAEESELRRLVVFLHDLAEAEEVPVPADFRPRLRTRLEQLPPPVSQPRRIGTRTGQRRWSLPAAAAAVAAGFTFLLQSSVPQLTGLGTSPTPVVQEGPAQPSGDIAMHQPGPSGSVDIGEPSGGAVAETQLGPDAPANGGGETITGGGESSPPAPPPEPADLGQDGDTGATPAAPTDPASEDLLATRVEDEPEVTLPGEATVASPQAEEASPAATGEAYEVVWVSYETHIRSAEVQDVGAAMADLVTQFPDAALVGDAVLTEQGELQYTLSVALESSEELIAAVHSIGEPVDSQLTRRVDDRTAEYEAKMQELEESKRSKAELEQTLQQPDTDPMTYAPDLQLVTEKIADLEQDLMRLQARSQIALVTVTVEPVAAAD